MESPDAPRMKRLSDEAAVAAGRILGETVTLPMHKAAVDARTKLTLQRSVIVFWPWLMSTTKNAQDDDARAMLQRMQEVLLERLRERIRPIEADTPAGLIGDLSRLDLEQYGRAQAEVEVVLEWTARLAQALCPR